MTSWRGAASDRLQAPEPFIPRHASAFRTAPPVTTTIQYLTPDLDAAWDAYVQTHPDASPCHTGAWRRSVSRTFGHADHSLVALRGGRVAGLLPMMLVRGGWAGRQLVSVPCGTGGGALADDAPTAQGLVRRARQIADDLRVSCLDLRSATPADPNLPTISRYVTFRRVLPDSPAAIDAWLPRKARAAARRADETGGLTTHVGLDGLPALWALYSRSMRRLGSLNYPRRFFESLADAFGDHVEVLLLRRGRRPAAGLLTFHFQGTASPTFVGTDERLRIYGVNNLLYRTAMRRAIEAGCRVYDFGRSRIENHGSADFKRLHGFEPTPLEYQRYVPQGRTAPDLTPSNPRFALARQVWRRMPLPLTRWLGSRLTFAIPG